MNLKIRILIYLIVFPVLVLLLAISYKILQKKLPFTFPTYSPIQYKTGNFSSTLEKELLEQKVSQKDKKEIIKEKKRK